MRKRRITVSVDDDLAAAGAAAVAAGRAQSLSAWVTLAMAGRAVKEQRLVALADAVAAYEAEHGVMSDEELVQQERTDRDAAARTRATAERRHGAA